MAYALTAGALISCNQGQVPVSYLLAGAPVAASETGCLVATVNDAVPFVNILTFGTCKILTDAAQGVPVPCVPATSAWSQPSSTMKLGGAAIATVSSKCSCAIGGSISVTAPGMTLVEVG